jgi:hypothetical protein
MNTFVVLNAVQSRDSWGFNETYRRWTNNNYSIVPIVPRDRTSKQRRLRQANASM